MSAHRMYSAPVAILPTAARASCGSHEPVLARNQKPRNGTTTGRQHAIEFLSDICTTHIRDTDLSMLWSRIDTPCHHRWPGIYLPGRVDHCCVFASYFHIVRPCTRAVQPCSAKRSVFHKMISSNAKVGDHTSGTVHHTIHNCCRNRVWRKTIRHS